MQGQYETGQDEDLAAIPASVESPSFLGQIPGVLGVFDGPDHICTFVNVGYRQLLSRGDIVGKAARDVLLGSQRSSLVDIFDQVYITGEPYTAPALSTPRLTPSGETTTTFLDFTIKPIRDARDRVTGVMVHAVDVTEQVRARFRAERLAAEQAAIFMHMADSVIILDRTDKVTYANEAARTLLGLDPAGLTLNTFMDAIQATAVEGEIDQLHPGSPDEVSSEHPVPASADWRICRPDGARLYVEATVAPVGAPGNPLGTVMVLRDTTTRHYLDEQKAAFLSSVAHDLRTPVTSIKGRAQMLIRRVARPDDMPGDVLQRELERIDASTTRVATLITELLDVANAHLGHGIQLHRQPTDLVSLARDTVSQVQQSADFHTIVFDAHVPEIIGNWDAARLQRAISNLLSNAVKYSPAGGAITVQVQKVSDAAPMALLRVTDEGVGIPASDLPSIFERFRRGRNVGEIAGTGIGLAAVEETVRQHGGSISVESEEGTGTTFTMQLPLGMPGGETVR